LYVDYQTMIFRQASEWTTATAAVVVGIGLLYTLQGFRFAWLLLPISNGICGFAFGGTVAASLGLAPVPVAIALGLGAAAVTVARYRVGVGVASVATFTVLGYYLGSRLTEDTLLLMVLSGVGLVTGTLLPFVARRALPMVITTVQGAGLLVVGFVGLASRTVPTLATTFVEWSESLSLMVPVLLAMVITLGISVQANLRQGDIETGGAIWIEEGHD